MKGFRFLLLVMVICLTNGVKAQFYDGPDEIYYYVQYKYVDSEPLWDPWKNAWKYPHTTKNYREDDNSAEVVVFNFDGKKGAILGCGTVLSIKSLLKDSSTYYEDKVETTDYELNFVSSSSATEYADSHYTYSFSQDRRMLVITHGDEEGCFTKSYLKRVDKSFFKVGRSRTPSGTLHE